MNGFLVVGRCGMDEIPMGLFDTRGGAEAFALSLTRQSVIDQARQYMLDVSMVFHVGVLEFRNGKPWGSYWNGPSLED